MRWEKFNPVLRLTEQGANEPAEVSGPGRRWGHTCNAVKGGQHLYIFGGYGKNNFQTNLVHVFDTDRQTWSEAGVKGNPPCPRDSHSCTTVANNLFVFGGTDGINPLNDLHVLDTSSHTWMSPSVKGEGPEAREGHSAALVGKELFIFGGCGKSPVTSKEVYYNDVYILDTETFVWKCAETFGTPPSARDSHTCSSWNNNIIVIGGEDGNGSYLSDVYILDTGTLTWRVLETSGKLPPRAGHSTVAFGKNLFVFGGFTDDRNLYDDLHMLDVESGLWAKVTATGDEPSARFSAAGDSLDPQKGGVLVFIGGCNMHLEPLNEVLFLHTGLANENRSYIPKMEKLSMKKQLRLKSQELKLRASPLNQIPPNVGTSAVPFQSSPVPVIGQQNIQLDASQQGKRKFQAKVTDKVPGGYTIETVIDGMLLRGVVFSNKKPASTPPPPPPANASSSRKRGPKASRGIKINDDHNSQTNDVQGNESAESNPQNSTVAAPIMQSLASSGDATRPHEVGSSAQPNAQTTTVAAPILQNLTSSGDATHPHEVPEISSAVVAPAVNADGDVVMSDVPNPSTANADENMTAATNDPTSIPSQDGSEAN